MATTTLTFGRLYSSNYTYEHSNQILHIPEINDTTSATFLSKYGFTGKEKVTNLSVKLPLRVGEVGKNKTFNDLRIVIFNGFTGTINNSASSSTAWFSHSSHAPDIDNMLIKWTSGNANTAAFTKTAIDAGNLIGTPLAYIDTSFTSSSDFEYIGDFNSSNSTITILPEGKDINNWAPKGYKVASGYGLFIGFYNTVTNFWSDTVALGAGAGLNWGRANASPDPYAYVTVTTSTGIVKYYDGSTWKDCEIYYHDGSDWQQCEVQYHDGSGWKDIGN